MANLFNLTLDDLYDDDTFSASIANNQVNLNPEGKPLPLKSTLATDPTPQRSLTSWDYSSIMQGAGSNKNSAYTLDTFNQIYSEFQTGTVIPAAETNIQDALGTAYNVTPQDIIDRVARGELPLSSITDAAGQAASDAVGQAINQNYPPPPPGTTRGTTALRTIWGSVCAPQGSMQTITLWSNDAKITVRNETVPVWLMVNNIAKKYDYKFRKADTGAFNCRAITGGSGLSLHSFGIAVDFNWTTNPYGRVLKYDMPDDMIKEILKIKTKSSGLTCLRWGGHYKTNKDAMHWEVVVSASELAEGITLPGMRTAVGGIGFRLE